MICLACGGENGYGSVGCRACGKPFQVFPPYVKSNHVCQLQAVIRDYQQGAVALEELGDCYGRFADLAMAFMERWKLMQGLSLAERLEPTLRETFHSGLVEIDRAMVSLDEALGSMDEFLETGEAGLLAAAHDLLTDFFKISCGGCAIIIDELEKQGHANPYGTLLDVRGL